jgi:SRSO17 transposase
VARLAAAHVPPEVGFTTKPRLARHIIERALEAGVPFAWVAGDSVYGVGEIEMALRRAGRGYVLGVNSTQTFTKGGSVSKNGLTSISTRRVERDRDRFLMVLRQYLH